MLVYIAGNEKLTTDNRKLIGKLFNACYTKFNKYPDYVNMTRDRIYLRIRMTIQSDIRIRYSGEGMWQSEESVSRSSRNYGVEVNLEYFIGSMKRLPVNYKE